MHAAACPTMVCPNTKKNAWMLGKVPQLPAPPGMPRRAAGFVCLHGYKVFTRSAPPCHCLGR